MDNRKEPAATHFERTNSSLALGDGPPSDCQSQVLVVDDNPLNAKLVLAQLRQNGYEATSVEGGEAALVALASISYSLVLMDCEMPGMDGCATTREIRRHEGPERHLVVIGLSSNTADSARAKCLAAGMDGYIARPVTSSQLIAELRRLGSSFEQASPSDLKMEKLDATTTPPITTLDPNVVAELAILEGTDGVPLLLELKVIFLRNLPAMLCDLSRAANVSTSELARAAHYLKSASTTIGGVRLASLCAKIEQTCSRDDSSRLGPSVIEALEEAALLAEKLSEIPLC